MSEVVRLNQGLLTHQACSVGTAETLLTESCLFLNLHQRSRHGDLERTKLQSFHNPQYVLS